MMRFFYTLFFYLLTPFILLRLFWKGRRLPAYRARLSERFSLNQPTHRPVDVWVHAVSLGEVIAASALVNCLLRQNLQVCFTTMTPTGSAEVQRRFGGRLLHQYIPYDLPYALRRFFRQIKPRVGIVMETELWPNLIWEAKRARVSLFLANARISDRAYPQYQRISWVLKPLLNQFDCIMAQSPKDAARYMALCGSPEKVKMFGNLKFDVSPPISNLTALQSIKILLGKNRPWVMLASTHDNEERLFLEQLSRLKCLIPNVLISIAPRHPERFQVVFDLCVSMGYKTGRRSSQETLTNDLDIVVLDSLGELFSFYTLCDYAFVGGSLVPVGGHNVLEPILVGVPVLCGPFMQNSQSIVDVLCAEKAVIQVSNASDLVSAISLLHEDEILRKAQIERATRMIEDNQGALSRHLSEINQRLNFS